MRTILAIFHAIFGDRPAERAGKAFMNYFNSEKCPPAVRQDIELNVIYWDAWLDGAHFESTDDFFDCMDFYFAAHRRKLAAEEEEKK